MKHTAYQGRSGRKICVTLFICWLLTLPLLPVSQAAPQPDAPAAVMPTLVVGVVHDPPYIFREKDGEWAGVNLDIWKAVAQELKVNYVLKEMTFNELLSSLKQGSIDLSIEAFFVTAERARWMHYSFPFGNTRLAVAMLPEKAAHPWWVAMKIFLSWGTFKVALVFCFILCALGFLFWLIERKSNPEHFGGSPLEGVGSGIYWVGATLASGVCFGIALKSVWARILGLLWMLVCAIALSALIASLTAALTESRARIEVINEDSLRQMHLGGIRGSAESALLKELGGEYTLFPGEEAAINAVVDRQIDGFLYDELTLSYYKDHDYKGKIAVIPTGLRRFLFGFGLPWGSSWSGKIDAALLNLMEKPDWVVLLKRYGLGESFEVKAAEHMLKKRR
ncbi:MAG TPA: transporter substrate-binding domain-containing protein [Syntrophorhabdales bacterium]|nr:transporter substrate-binding domain-containing protein [Syntrophorhabdales bacterium]